MSATSRLPELARAARWHAEHNIDPGDMVAVITNPTVHPDIPLAFATAAAQQGAEVVMVNFRPPKVPGEEPPRLIRDIMASADASVTCGSESLSFTNAMLAATQNGKRHLSVPGASINTFTQGIVEVYFDEAEFRKMKDRILRYRDVLTKARTIRVFTPAGTDLTASIDGRLPTPSYGIAREHFNHTSFPTGEIHLPPVEGTANGVAVIDVSMGVVGRVGEPLRFHVRDGMVVKVEGGPEARVIENLLARFGDPARNLAEIGLGMNHKGLVTGNKNEDKKIAGTAHVALGDNHTFGSRMMPGLAGDVEAPIHVDCVMWQATVLLDGEPVIQDGVLLC